MVCSTSVSIAMLPVLINLALIAVSLAAFAVLIRRKLASQIKCIVFGEIIFGDKCKSYVRSVFSRSVEIRFDWESGVGGISSLFSGC